MSTRDPASAPGDMRDIELLVEALRLVDEAKDNTDLSQKESQLWRAGELFESIDDHRGAAGAMACLALVYEQTGRDSEAERTYRQAIEVFDSAELHYEAIDTALCLGRFLVRSGRGDVGVTTLRTALERARGLKSRELEGLALLDLGVALADVDGVHEGGELLDQAAQVLREVHDDAGLGRCLEHTGALLARVGRFDDAVEAYRESITALLDANRDDWAADVADGLADVFANRGQHELAAKTRAEAAALRRAWLDNHQQ